MPTLGVGRKNIERDFNHPESLVETIRLHIKNAIAKLNATNRSQAVAKAVHLGLI